MDNFWQVLKYVLKPDYQPNFHKVPPFSIWTFEVQDLQYTIFRDQEVWRACLLFDLQGDFQFQVISKLVQLFKFFHLKFQQSS